MYVYIFKGMGRDDESMYTNLPESTCGDWCKSNDTYVWLDYDKNNNVQSRNMWQVCSPPMAHEVF